MGFIRRRRPFFRAARCDPRLGQSSHHRSKEMKILDIPRSGSYAGSTSSHNRAGQYVRSRRTPTNAPSARRTLVRSAMGSASSGYSSLTDAQRAAWAAAADAHPTTDRLGSSIKLTGHQLYVSIYASLVNSGSSMVSTPPSDFSVFSVAGSSLAFSVATGAIVSTTGLGGASDNILIAFSKPVPAGRSFVATFSQLLVALGSATSTTVGTVGYAGVFGSPVVGQKVFARLTPISQYGVKGVPVVVSAVVVA